jgi:hypothetical protein
MKMKEEKEIKFIERDDEKKEELDKKKEVIE